MWDRVGAAHTGAAWLDEHEPGWTNDIVLSRLDLANCLSCVLGQLQARRHGRWNGYFGYLTDQQRTPQWAAVHGFQLPALLGLWKNIEYENELLTGAWLDEIIARLQVTEREGL